MRLPTEPQTRESVNPLAARVMLAGLPKVGKTTLAAEWAPKTTLIVDTHRGSTFLEGEHYVQHVSSWNEFADTVKLLTSEKHPYKTVIIDLIDDIWKFADTHVADQKRVVTAGMVEYGKGIAEAEGLFRRAVGSLLASSLGIWFLSHTDTEDNQGQVRYVPRLDRRVRTYVEGACQFIFLAESLGKKRQLHTSPTARFQAGSRLPLPDVMDMDARQLFAAMRGGLNQKVKKSES